MDDQPTTGSRLRRYVRSRWFLAASATVGLLLVALALFVGWFWLMWNEGHVDAAIPPGRARAELADRLRRYVGVDLDPDARIVAAHETRNGTRGGGDSWFLARLGPEATARFEANFLATVRAGSGSVRLVPYADRVAERHALRGLGPGPSLPAGARAWWLDDRRSTCAVFFDDQFYFYLDAF